MSLYEYAVIILAAGLGKRLAPLTHLLPKPACPLYGEPICVSMMRQLFAAGATTIHINTSYLATNLEGEVKAYLAETNPEILARLRFWHEPQRLETGGAIVRIWQELGRPSVKGLFVVSGDIVGQIPIEALLNEFEQRDKDTSALMAVKSLSEQRSDVTWVDQENRLVVGFGRNLQKEPYLESNAPKATLFTNYQIIAPEALENIPLMHASSIPLIYGPILQKNRKIGALFIQEDLPWFNVGTPQEYSECLTSLHRHDWRNLISSRSGAQPADQSERPKQDSFTGKLLCVAPDHSHPDLTLTIQPMQIRQLIIQRLNTLPKQIALSETQSFDFKAGLERFLKLIAGLFGQNPQKRLWEARAPEPRCRGERLTLWLRVPTELSDTFTIQVPQPILVGGNHFLEIALSQRGSLEAAPDWVDLLLTDSDLQPGYRQSGQAH